jgi:hypothetical protein
MLLLLFAVAVAVAVAVQTVILRSGTLSNPHLLLACIVTPVQL